MQQFEEYNKKNVVTHSYVNTFIRNHYEHTPFSIKSVGRNIFLKCNFNSIKWLGG